MRPVSVTEPIAGQIARLGRIKGPKAANGHEAPQSALDAGQPVTTTSGRRLGAELSWQTPASSALSMS